MSDLTSLNFNAALDAARVRTQSVAWDEIQRMAESVQRDIKADFGDVEGFDDGYNLYVEWLDVQDGKGVQLYGVIDMGDYYHEALVYSGEWEPHHHPEFTSGAWPFELETMILRKRGF